MRVLISSISALLKQAAVTPSAWIPQRMHNETEVIINPWKELLCKLLEQERSSEVGSLTEIADVFEQGPDELAIMAGDILNAVGPRCSPIADTILRVLKTGSATRQVLAARIGGHLPGNEIVHELYRLYYAGSAQPDGVMPRLTLILAIVRHRQWLTTFLTDALTLPTQQWELDLRRVIMEVAGHLAVNDLMGGIRLESGEHRRAFALEELAATLKSPEKYPDRELLRLTLRRWIPGLVQMLHFRDQTWRRSAARALRFLLTPNELFCLLAGEPLSAPSNEGWTPCPKSWLEAEMDEERYFLELAPLVQGMLSDRANEILPVLYRIKESFGDERLQLLCIDAIDGTDASILKNQEMFDPCCLFLQEAFMDERPGAYPAVKAIAAVAFINKRLPFYPKDDADLNTLHAIGKAWKVFGDTLAHISEETHSKVRVNLGGRIIVSSRMLNDSFFIHLSENVEKHIPNGRSVVILLQAVSEGKEKQVPLRAPSSLFGPAPPALLHQHSELPRMPISGWPGGAQFAHCADIEVSVLASVSSSHQSEAPCHLRAPTTVICGRDTSDTRFTKGADPKDLLGAEVTGNLHFFYPTSFCRRYGVRSAIGT